MTKDDGVLLNGHQLLALLGGDLCRCPTGEGWDRWAPSLVAGVGVPVLLVVIGTLVSWRRAKRGETVDCGE